MLLGTRSAGFGVAGFLRVALGAAQYKNRGLLKQTGPLASGFKLPFRLCLQFRFYKDNNAIDD